MQFLQWLRDRPEDEVVVVSHHAFLFQLFSNLILVDPPVASENDHFSNCEMRSYVLDLSNIPLQS